MSNYVFQIFITGSKEAVNRMLEEVMAEIGTPKIIREDGANCTVALGLDEEDWIKMDEKGHSLEDLSNTYGVTIFEDVYNTEYEADYCQTTIIEPGDGAPKTTVIEPRHSLNDYEEAFDKLIEYDPERYRKLKIEALEALTNIIQSEIAQERIKLVKEDAVANNGRVFIPKDVTEAGPYDFCGFPIESIEVHPDNPKYSSEGNCLLSKDRTTVILGCKNSVIPEGVSEIECRAFAGCKDLVHIDVPESVRIMHGAFDGCPCEADFENRYNTEDIDWINELFK